MVAMNSIPQQDVANGSGHMEFLRARPTTLSRLVAKKPAPSTPGGFSATVTLFNGTVSILLPVEGPSFNDVEEAYEQKTNKHYHFYKPDHAQFPEKDSPGIHEYYLNIKQHKKNRHQKVFDGERYSGIAHRFNSAFE